MTDMWVVVGRGRVLVLAFLLSLGAALALARVADADVATSFAGGCASQHGVDGLPAGMKPPAWADHQFVHFMPGPASSQAGSALALGACPLVAGEPGQRIQYHGGVVQHEPKLFLLWWGSNWEGLQAGRSTAEALSLFYNNLKAENELPGSTAAWQGILSQYYSVTGSAYHNAHIGAEGHITSVTAPHSLTMSELQKAVTEWVNSVKEHYKITPNYNAQFIVLAAPGSTFTQEVLPRETKEGVEYVTCGFHSKTNATFTGERSDEYYSYTLVGYAGDTDCSNGSEAEKTHSTTGTASHEFAESVTDSAVNAGYGPEQGPYRGTYGWISAAGDEIADECEDLGTFQLPYRSYVTKLWDDERHSSNPEGECALEDPPYEQIDAPSVTTQSATGSSIHGATVNGTINPHGPDAEYWWEYGFGYEEGKFGHRVPVSNSETSYGSTAMPVSEYVGTGPGASVHYRLVASTFGGATYGEEQHFTTPYEPPVVKTEGAKEVGPTAATLRAEGTGNTDGATYHFEYGTTPSYGQSTEAQPLWGPTLSQAVGSFSPNTTYHYRVVGTNSGGTSYGTEMTFTTPPSPYVVSEQPTSVASTEATLHGAVNPGGHETTYQLEYWPSGHESEVAHVPATPESVGAGTKLVRISKTVTGLAQFGEYDYRIRATSSLGTQYGATVALTMWPVFGDPEITKEPHEGDGIKLTGVSCSSPSLCMAVGHWTSKESASEGVIQTWNGTKWSQISVPSTPEALLESVQCLSTTDCIAVGGDYAATWNGSTWSVDQLSTSLKLHSITCRSATFCMAVGNASSAEWNGSTWQTLSTPNATLGDVTCASTTTCIATGWVEFEQPTVQKWNGSTWTIEKLPIPEGNGEVNAASCVSTSYCMAVATYKDAQGYWRSAAAIWNGSTWAGDPMPGPAGSEEDVYARAVSCYSATSCAVVGQFEDDRVQNPMVERWNGTVWSIEGETRTYEGKEIYDATFNSVACSSALVCTAVGQALIKTGPTTGYDAALAENVQLSPGASTEAATGIGSTAATLNGTVTPEDRETTYHFEYGTTTAYGSETTSKVAVARTGTEVVSTAVEHLEPEATYHYRLVVANGDGITDGADKTFTTGLESTYLGSFGGTGASEGAVSAPHALTVNANGNLLLADSVEGRIDVFNPAGEYLRAFGSGGTEEEKLTEPQGVAVDKEGKVWVANTGSSKLDAFSEQGTLLKAIGGKGHGLDKFSTPAGVAVGDGYVYVADSGNDRVQKFEENGTFTDMFGYGVHKGEEKLETCTGGCRAGTAGSGPGQFNDPRALAVGANGRVFVADTGNDRIEYFNEAGEYGGTFGSAGTKPGQFSEPDGITVVQGYVYVVDSGNKRVQQCTEAGICKVFIGTNLESPSGIEFGSEGDAFVGDEHANHVAKFSLVGGP